MDEDAMVVLVTFIIASAVLTVAVLTGYYTHQSNLKTIKYNRDKIVACLDHGFKPMDCRDMVYGRGQ